MIGIANKSTKPQIELPERPIRPLTPYMRYIKENVSKTTMSEALTKQSNQIKFAKLANTWSSMDAAAKAKYQEGYAEEYVCKHNDLLYIIQFSIASFLLYCA